jgi:hypothetical protein
MKLAYKPSRLRGIKFYVGIKCAFLVFEQLYR